MKVKDVLKIIQDNQNYLTEIRNSREYFDERYCNYKEVAEADIKVKKLEEEYEAWLDQDVI